jgi:hypothetical protein
VLQRAKASAVGRDWMAAKVMRYSTPDERIGQYRQEI